MANGPDPSPLAKAPAGWPSALGWLWRAAVWLPAVLLGMVLAGALAVGLWAGSEGSLAQAIRWGLAWQAQNAPQLGLVQIDGAQGSVLNGGKLASVSWAREGQSVQAQDLTVSLGARFWAGLLGGEVHIETLRAARVRIGSERATAPPPRSPPESLTLPVPIEMSVAVDELVLPDGQSLNAMQAQYRYGSAASGLGVADAHTLTLRSLRWAEGRYQAQVTLGAQAPMPLRLQANGELRATVPEGGSIDLRARATAQGTLAGDGAVLDLTAQITPATSNDATPTLAGTARVRPWATQPVAEADLRLHRLNLGLLWPAAPQTALTGTVRAQPDGSDWRAQVQLQNESSGAIDRGRVPVRALELALVQSGARWTLERLDAQVAGGRLQGKGRRDAPADGAASSLGDWQGEFGLSGIDPAQIWSRLAPASLDGRLQARAVNPQSPAPQTPFACARSSCKDAGNRRPPSRVGAHSRFSAHGSMPSMAAWTQKAASTPRPHPAAGAWRCRCRACARCGRASWPAPTATEICPWSWPTAGRRWPGCGTCRTRPTSARCCARPCNPPTASGSMPVPRRAFGGRAVWAPSASRAPLDASFRPRCRWTFRPRGCGCSAAAMRHWTCPPTTPG
ncbi:MAG: hypothetical protein MUE35_13335 [Hydrogenophaga sp.]|nr:hypothetical protein [Hydrogenophaga sp.]